LSNDREWMRRALVLARQAGEAGEVPVGAVLVKDGMVLAEGGNRPISTLDPTAHAEVVVLREAAERLGNYRLIDTTLYVTLEPCAMCVGAMIHARVKRLVFATTDPRTGCCGSATDLIRAPFHNHRIEVDAGLLADESAQLLKAFFRARRKAGGTPGQ